MCVRRGITQTIYRKSCGMIKSANHIFRTCQRATKVWNAVLGIDNYDPSDINFFFFGLMQILQVKRVGETCRGELFLLQLFGIFGKCEMNSNLMINTK